MSDRYTVLGSLAKGGMGVIYLGRMIGSAGFSRLVAIKRLRRELATERDFVAMLVDEARMASRIRHANVIDTLDLVVEDGEFSLVLEYVEGESLSTLVTRARELGENVPRPIALAIMYGVLRGLDAAHDARSDDGSPLGLVHRDVSPQNVLVGVDGVPRIIDFGVAKALGRIESTRPGEVRGKFAYMAPEQVLARPVTRQADVYAAGILFWELLAQRRLFTNEERKAIIDDVLRGTIPEPSAIDPDVPAALDGIVKQATARDLGARFLSAREFLVAIETFPRASDDQVGAWVRRLAADELARRQRLVQDHAQAAESHSIEELMRDRSGADDADATEVATTRTEALAPLAAVFAHPGETVTTAVLPPAPARSGRRSRSRIAVGALFATLGLLVFLGARHQDSAPEVERAVAAPSIERAEEAAPPPSAPPEAAVVAVPASAAPSASVPVRVDPRRRKPAPKPYDPGNFR